VLYLNIIATVGLLVSLFATDTLADSGNLVLPEIGDTASAALSPVEEQKLGASVMRKLRQKGVIMDNPAFTTYIEDLGHRLSSNTDTRGYEFSFFLVNDPTINAFALPGGYIGVHTGLISATQSENELAAVLAHEIAHVTQHHIARSVEAAHKAGIPALAGLAAAIALARYNREAGQAAISAVAAGSQQFQLDFTRSNEQEADRIGIQILHSAGFDPRSMPAFFERLQQASRYYGLQAPEFLRTHPVTESRIADSRNRAEQYPPVQTRDSLAYHLLQTRLRLAQEPNPHKRVKDFQTALRSDKSPNQEAIRYGYAVALLEAGQLAEAEQQILRLLKKNPEEPAFLMLHAQLKKARGKPKEAESILADALTLYPDNPVLTPYYAGLLLERGQAAKAAELLEAYVDYRPQDPELRKLLAEAQSRSGNRMAAHRSRAEYHYLRGETTEAIEHLKIALNLVKYDDYQAAQIQARIKEIQRTEKEESQR
jgi:predicted Zn-dependent protease